MLNELKLYSAPNAEEFEDLTTFLKCRHKKKAQEKAECAQWRIPEFFTRIKKEAIYDGDDEVSCTSPVVLRTSPVGQVHTQTPSPPGKVRTLSPRGREKTSPGALNKLAVYVPAGTFIPISATFKSIMSARTSSEVRKNLQTTFEEQIPKDKTGHKSPIDISPIRLSDVEEDMPAKVHEEMQTEPVNIVQSEVQTELATEMKLCQTEWEQKGIGCQMEWEQKGIGCQMAWEQKGIGCQTEIENAVKVTQTEYGTQVQGTQTEIVSKVQETQTEKHMEDKQCETNWEQQGMACQTEIENASKETQTEIQDNNILTVDRLEIVEHMETQGTQTDLAELEAMQPFWEVHGPNPLDVDNNKDDTETESILSSASKSEDVPKIATGAGLDMRRGEYHEVEFPPVASTLVKHKPVESTPKQQTLSPVDLCTTTKGTVNKKKSEEENTTSKKVIPLCAISEDPRDVLRGVSKQKPSDLKLTPAHGMNPGGSLSKVNIEQQMCVKCDIPATDLRKNDNESPKSEDGPGIKPTSPLAYSSLSG